ncbi:MAG: hypothetical protein IJL89_06565, partial [Firmicutes bacterium]|nr:hypothetical protein [Bacillota bacterium]
AAAVAMLIFGMAAGCEGKTAENSGGENMGTVVEENGKKVDFELISVLERGTMIGEQEYEIKAAEDGGVIISDYYGAWRFMEEVEKEDCLKRRAVGGAELYEKAAELLGNCDIKAWNGFDGNNPMVLDGYGFTLEGSLKDGTRLYARGTNAFPDGYDKFMSDIRDLLQEYGEEIPQKETE